MDLKPCKLHNQNTSNSVLGLCIFLFTSRNFSLSSLWQCSFSCLGFLLSLALLLLPPIPVLCRTSVWPTPMAKVPPLTYNAVYCQSPKVHHPLYRCNHLHMGLSWEPLTRLAIQWVGHSLLDKQSWSMINNQLINLTDWLAHPWDGPWNQCINCFVICTKEISLSVPLNELK